METIMIKTYHIALGIVQVLGSSRATPTCWQSLDNDTSRTDPIAHAKDNLIVGRDSKSDSNPCYGISTAAGSPLPRRSSKSDELRPASILSEAQFLFNNVAGWLGKFIELRSMQYPDFCHPKLRIRSLGA